MTRMTSRDRSHCGLLRIACLGLLLGTFAVGRARADATEEARQHFKAGVRHLQDPDGVRYEDAYREFRAAYAASPNPKILGNVGYCAMKLERDGEAIAAYARYLAETTDVDLEERDQVSKDLMTMRSGLVRVTVHAEPGVTLTVIDTRTPVTGTAIANAYGPVNGGLEIGVRPGHHVLRARTQNGDEPKPWEIDAAPGAKLDHTFVVVKSDEAARSRSSSSTRSPSDDTRSSHAVPWLVTGLGGTMLLGAAVTGIIVWTRVQRLDSRCPNDTCPAGSGLDGDRETTKRLMRATDFLLVGGGVVATTGVLWLLFSSDAGARERETAPRTSSISPPNLSCSGVGCTLSITGKF